MTKSSLSHLQTKVEHDQAYRDNFRSENALWIKQYEHMFPHAVTLTFNHTKVRRQLMAIDSTLTLGSDTMVELYKANMRTFKWSLAKSLYGNAWKRFDKPFVWIPVLEGIQSGSKPHYHCILGVGEDRHQGLEQQIKTVWQTVPFSGDRVTVEAYRDGGWINYCTKSTGWLDRQGIDWENVLVPRI
jgi:hypothetical protein